MRLLFITQDFPPEIGGIQTYSYEIAKRLASRCEDFVVVAPDKPDAQRIDSQLDFEVLRIKTKNTLLGYAAIPKVMRLLKQRQINTVFHAQWQTLPVSVRAKKRGLVGHVCVAAHARELFFNPFSQQKIINNWYENYRKKLITQADFFIPVSQYTSDALSQFGIDASKRKVVINGTDPDFFFPLNNKSLKEKYGYTNQKILLTTTRLVARKGVDTVLQALPKIIRDIPNIKYLIVGEGSFKPELQRIIGELQLENYVEFVGRIPYSQLNEYYNLADVYVMPAKAVMPDIEGFGIVFLEAGSCKKAVIGTRTGGIPDAILHEETGLLVDEQNPTQLAEAITRLLADDKLRTRMGEAGRARVLREANWDRVGELIFDLINVA